MLKHMTLTYLTDPGVVAIIRSSRAEGLVEAAAALYEGGARAVEISLTTPGALGAVSRIHASLPPGCVIGVGTVLDAETLPLAIEAGAQFVVSPVCGRALIDACHRHGLPILAGAYTPTEALNAYEAGADLIKIFPANSLGPDYIRALRAPLPQLSLVPTGGVTVANCRDYFAAGCAAVGVGGRVVNGERIVSQDWQAIREGIREYVEAARSGRDSSPA